MKLSPLQFPPTKNNIKVFRTNFSLKVKKKNEKQTTGKTRNMANKENNCHGRVTKQINCILNGSLFAFGSFFGTSSSRVSCPFLASLFFYCAALFWGKHGTKDVYSSTESCFSAVFNFEKEVWESCLFSSIIWALIHVWKY